MRGKPAPELTPEEKAEILRLRPQGRWGRMDPRKIGRILDISEDRIRAFLGLNPNHAPYRSRQPYQKSPLAGRIVLEGAAKIPPHVVADRDHRLSLEHHSLSAAFFGDPPPGYSALDRRNGKNQTTA